MAVPQRTTGQNVEVSVSQAVPQVVGDEEETHCSASRAQPSTSRRVRLGGRISNVSFFCRRRCHGSFSMLLDVISVETCLVARLWRSHRT